MLSSNAIEELLEVIMETFAGEGFDTLFISHKRGKSHGGQSAFMLYTPNREIGKTSDADRKLEYITALRSTLNDAKGRLAEHGIIFKYTLLLDNGVEEDREK